MASNLAPPRVCFGQYNACIVRLALLGPDCRPTGGVNGGIVTGALVDLTADPDIEAGQVFEPKTGCGKLAFQARQQDIIKGYTISGNMIFYDWEMVFAMFGGTLILGKAGGSFVGQTIGHAEPLYNSAARNGVYLEVITQVATSDGGDCPQTTGVASPAAVGHIFGKARFTPGSKAFGNDTLQLAFTGYANNNAYLFNGPWNDFPGGGYIPNSPHVQMEYSIAEYNAIAATVQCGWVDLPAGS